MGVLLPANHELSALQKLSFNEIEKEKILTYTDALGAYWNGHIQAHHDRPLRFKKFAEYSEQIIEGVRQHQGIAVFPSVTEQYIQHTPNVVYRPLISPMQWWL